MQPELVRDSIIFPIFEAEKREVPVCTGSERQSWGLRLSYLMIDLESVPRTLHCMLSLVIALIVYHTLVECFVVVVCLF